MAGKKPVKYEYHGEMFSMRELSEMSGICETTLRKRIADGHTMNDAIDNHEELMKLAKENQLANLRNHGGRKKKEAYINGSGYPDPTAGEAIMNNMAEYMNEPVEEKDPRIINDRRVGEDDIWITSHGKQVYIRECYPDYCVCYDVIDPNTILVGFKKVITDIFPCVDLNLRENNVGIFYTRPKYMYYGAFTDYRFTLTPSCVSDKDWDILHGKEHYHRLRGRNSELAKKVEELTKKNKSLSDAYEASQNRIDELEAANGSMGDELIQTIERCNKYRIENEQLHAELENSPNKSDDATELEAANGSMGDELIQTKETCEDYERAIETLRGVNKQLRAEIANLSSEKSDDATELEPPMDVTMDKLRMELEVNKRVYQEAMGWLLSILR